MIDYANFNQTERFLKNNSITLDKLTNLYNTLNNEGKNQQKGEVQNETTRIYS